MLITCLVLFNSVLIAAPVSDDATLRSIFPPAYERGLAKSDDLREPITSSLKAIEFYNPVVDALPFKDNNQPVRQGAGSQSERVLQKSFESNLLPTTLALTMFNQQNISNTTADDAEPSIIAVDKLGTTLVSTAYIGGANYSGSPFVSGRIRQHTRNYFNGNNTTMILNTIVSGPGYLYNYPVSVDPYTAVNSYTSGVAPKRQYTTGLLKLEVGANDFPRSIVVWHSDNSMQSWSGPVEVETKANAGYKLDKPHVAVSAHWATRGHVYVAYSRLAVTSQGTYDIVISRSTDGGLSFSNPVTINSNTDVQLGVQLVVSPYSGKLFAFWTNFDTDDIMWSMSSNAGASWTNAQIFANAADRGNKMVIKNNGTVNTPSLPIARYNWPHGEIAVVWHECNSMSSGDNCPTETDVFYARLVCIGANCSTTPVRVNDAITGDQFMPALDFNTAGNLMVTFFDQRNAPANNQYELFSAWINHFGQNLQPNEVASNFQSVVDPGFIGDYHETWSHTLFGTEHFFSAWIGDDGIQDAYVSELLP